MRRTLRSALPRCGQPTMAGRVACSLALGVMLVLPACSSAPRTWHESGGAGHPLLGQIYRVADGRAVSEDDLLDAAAAAEFVLIGERADNRDHHRLQAEIVSALQSEAPAPRAVAFEMIGADRQLAAVEHLDAHPGDAPASAPPWAGRRAAGPIGRCMSRSPGRRWPMAPRSSPPTWARQKRAVFEQGARGLRTQLRPAHRAGPGSRGRPDQRSAG